ncbi:hypothetical protein BBJ28_00010622 [Nothophytophthora sp. Chile5]|nr:hypothetical protein BBJ28_00010622 [Nothophytophthora sp. Chile5]
MRRSARLLALSVLLVSIAVLISCISRPSHASEVTETPIAAVMSTPTPAETKIEPALLLAIQNDVEVEADIMIRMVSPQQVAQVACDRSDAAALDRGQKITCMVDSLQRFAEQAQEAVKELLAQRSDQFTSSTFFWINNSVSVKSARGALVLALAQLEPVEAINVEQIFQLQSDTGSKEAGVAVQQ